MFTLVAAVVAMHVATAPAPMWQPMLGHAVLEAPLPYEGFCQINPDAEVCSATEKFFRLPLDKRSLKVPARRPVEQNI